MKVTERIAKLKDLMREKGIDVYLIPSADNHQSEYVGEYFKSREFISGFTGSAGTVVVTKDEVGLWTDGRYFIQAEEQLQGSGVTLFKMGEPGVPTTDEYICDVVPEGGTLGFDGRVIAMLEGKDLEEALAAKKANIVYSCDLIQDAWTDRPALSEKPVYILDESCTGESYASKVSRVRKAMEEKGTTTHIITTLDDVAWLYNLRGDDVEYTPVFLAYSIITMDKSILFVEDKKLPADVKTYLADNKVEVRDYNDIYEYVKGIPAGEHVLIDPKRVNYALYNNLPDSLCKVEAENPCILMKAMKNEVELKNNRNAHVKDGVAVTKFMYWLKKNVGKMEMSEISVSDKLAELRKEQEGFKDLSFETIAGYKEHGAIVHYAATPETDKKIEAESLLLLDSGAHYNDGTTDVTRTFVLGPITDEMKEHYTAVLRCNLDLSMSRFLHGLTGQNLDILARQPAWDCGFDFKHGTGHGVGYLLSVHEGPAGFRWQALAHKNETAVLEPGMVLSDEPGIYIQGSHGIRIENEIIVNKDLSNEYGDFLSFEPITYIPIDLDAVLPEKLTEAEKKYLNDYHKNVYEKVSPFLTEEEKEWLKEYTRAI